MRGAAGIRNQCQLNLGPVGCRRRIYDPPVLPETAFGGLQQLQRPERSRRGSERSVCSRNEAGRSGGRGLCASSAGQLTSRVGCEHGLADIGGA